MRLILLISIFISSASANPIYDKYSKVFPFIEKQTTIGDFKLSTGEKTATLTYIPKTKKGKGAVIIVPGWAEPIFRYDELYYDLRDAGVPIYGYDLLSQGLSHRYLEDHGKTHVDSFDQYEAQLAEFLEKIVRKKHKELVVISHSTGAQIVLRYARKNPKAFKHIILITPLFEIKMPDFIRSTALGITEMMVEHGFGGEYVAPATLLKSYKDSAISNRATSSVERFKMARTHWDELYPTSSSLGPTWGWALAAMNANREIADFDFSALKGRVTLFQAGNDYLVTPKTQDTFCKQVSCKKIRLEKGKHWLHREVDPIRNVLVDAIKSDIKANLR